MLLIFLCQHHCTLCICDVFSQVCDSDTVLDPACTIEMLKILEEDPMVGGVGGDVQVKYQKLKSIYKLYHKVWWLKAYYSML